MEHDIADRAIKNGAEMPAPLSEIQRLRERAEKAERGFKAAIEYQGAAVRRANEAERSLATERAETTRLAVLCEQKIVALGKAEREVESERKRADGWQSRAFANEDEVKRLDSAIKWALGEEGYFSLGKGMFWWRTELRRRAALRGGD